jgi:glutathione S-transferase
MGKPQLAYWDCRGRAYPIRFALAYMGVDYDYLVYPQAKEEDGGETTWASQKSKLGLESPNMPYWIDDSIKLSESKAILMYVIRKYAPTLIPSDLCALARVEMMEGLLNDIITFFGILVYTDTKEMHGMFDYVVPGKIAKLSEMLGDNKFSTGDKICYLDFLLYSFIYMLKEYKKELIGSYANLLGYMSSFEAVPEIAAFVKSSDYVERPCFGMHALIKL